MPEINGYQFGRMIISDETYTQDLIIFPDGTIKKRWYRENGHLLRLADLKDILEFSPDLLIVGTGASGRMAVDKSVRTHLHSAHIDLEVETTHNAAQIYNQCLTGRKKFAACFHLTC